MSGEPLLTGLLQRTICPTPLQTQFLRACLHGDLEAWDRWSRAVGDPKRELGNDGIGIKRLVPLLYTSLRDAGAPLDAEFLSYLRAAYVREDLRSRTFRRVCGEALGALSEAQIPFIVLKGVSLAESAYPVWALRHCHDVDLLVEQEVLETGPAVLGEFRAYSRDKDNVMVVHPTNMPVVFHARLFEHYDDPSECFGESGEREITGVRVRVLAPHNELLHLCVHAASGRSRLMLLWVADAMFLLRDSPSLDWKAFVGAARQTALPVYVLLRYLRDEMGAEVPAFVFEALEKQAENSRFRGQALRGVVSTIGYRGVIREAKGRRERLCVYGWAARQLPGIWRRRLGK
ncbi:hypothetical protein EON83_16200 [bacterium]|nr:MAG: hypothetical protein EON83_16200 [bacterium]